MANKGFQCYICKEYINKGHDQYWRMCEVCGDKNLAMRNRRIDMAGYIALVTGSRIKIGYHTALKLLRDGATVIATTRYPSDAAARYALEPDFLEWRDRLILCRLDLLRIDLLDSFIEYINNSFDYLDLIVNNAAQTVRMPDQYTKEMIEKEKNILSVPDMKIIESIGNTPLLQQGSSITGRATESNSINLTNSWVLGSSDVGTREFLEVQLINVTAPFMLNTKLKNMLLKSPHMNKFIINVSSVEGQFSQKKKGGYHVHTNMAKAALNMMTKTISREYSRDRIYTYSVDPGWVSNQFPADWANLKEEDFKAPLDYEDAAARLCYPAYEWLNTEKPDTGLFLKDYKKIEW